MGNDDDDIGEMIGKTMVSAKNIDDEVLEFEDTGGNLYRFFHSQNCCECVSIEDITGDLQDLVGSPILRAEERTENASKGDYIYESATWTFYEFATIKGSVTVRWLGESNGYYSEAVDLKIIKR